MGKYISIVSACFNEEQNVEPLYERISSTMEGLPDYTYELIFIDNCSADRTVENLKAIAARDKRVKIIVNRRNFGATRSGYHAVLQAHGEAIIYLVADLQDPPELIPQLLKLWEEGNPIVACVKTSSKENPVMYLLRTLFYRALNAVSDVMLVEHFTGFGLYDRLVIEEFRRVGDPYPYVRGLISDLGFSVAKVFFEQPKRASGFSKNGFLSLYSIAMQGLTSHSILPLRMASLLGFGMALICFVVGLFYLVYKLVYWTSFPVGMAPVIIGMFLVFAVQLIFIGLVGEYVVATHRHILARPRVIELERINFD